MPAAHATRARVRRARLALLVLLAGVLVPLAFAGLRSVLWLLLGIAGLALAAVGVWWAVAHTGLVRVCGVIVSVAAPLTVLALYAVYGMLGPALLSLALCALAVTVARTATAPGRAADGSGPSPAAAETPHRPWILMNPRSGGGKVDRFHLVDKALATGAWVTVLDTGHQDVAELARHAVAEGADLLAVAGGDGTQAQVAEVAHDHDLPFVVIPAGTRNHFARDLGLDGDDPAAALDAVSDGVELRVDLGFAADRVFVNTASFGTYAAVVGDPAYRHAKARTILQDLPELLTGDQHHRLRIRSGAHHADGLQAVLVSNNPYTSAVGPRRGRRDRLDSGLLGVLCVHVDNTAQAAGAVRGARSTAFTRLTGTEVVVDADAEAVPVGIDGEHVLLPAPVVCRIVPGALRVRVPRHRPGTPQSRPAIDWRAVARLARGRAPGDEGRPASSG
ncbi:diacylglycerol kinase family protein [Streptomyces sp. NPDC050803]|uniref:diacylglycerol/lipid kinase family protein n=1 Tax=unclassified Streptomyces TaxID=2593676 RepID=UPI0034440EC5